jgi:hypothetical protein
MKPIRKPINSKLVRKVFLNRGLTRSILPKAHAEVMMAEIKRLYEKGPQEFIAGLKLVKKKVYVGNFKGTPVAIKVTRGSIFEGANPKRVQKDITLHDEAIRRGLIDNKFYVLHTPLVYGTIGPLLIMEYIKESKRVTREEKNVATAELWANLGKSEKALDKKRKRDLVTGRLQTSDFIAAGKINGKVILYTAFDYI